MGTSIFDPFRLAIVLCGLVWSVSLPAQAISTGSPDPEKEAFLSGFLSTYLTYPSVTGHEREAGEFLARAYQEQGLSVRVLTREEDRFNLAASLYPLERGKPNIILLNHIDVVDPGNVADWRHPPFSGVIDDGEVWGRGAIDNKAMCAMEFAALVDFIPLARDKDLPFNVTLLSVSGEETGGATGAAIVADSFFHLLNPIVVLGEGGSGVPGVISSDPDKVLYGVSINHKRALWLRLKLVLSSAGHGSVPTKENATMQMVSALERLNQRKNNLFFSSSMKIMFTELSQYEEGMKRVALRNIGMFKPFVGSTLRREPIIHALVTNTIALTGIQNPEGSQNQVPQAVEAVLDCRLLPETDTDDFLEELKGLLANEHIQIEVIKETVKAEDTQPDIFYAMLEEALKRNHPGSEVAPILFPASNDNNYFRARGVSAYGILPIPMTMDMISSIHSVNERIPIHSLRHGTKVYRDFLSQIFDTALTPSALTQQVRGKIVDKALGLPLSDCMIILSNDTAVIHAGRSDLLGDFRMEQVPIGRYRLKVVADGFEKVDIPGIIVSTGHEVVLRLSLNELDDHSDTRMAMAKLSAMNEMSTVSTKTFDVEETGRYPGSREDPARMVANYPGVRGADDSRNDLIIRGNAPFGLKWRMEGIDIPNPNHFAISGTSGGGVNILNSQLLDRSDFYTGAFPAEFGNAIAGVFDLRLREGNNEQHEASVEFGSISTGITAEGPMSKNSRSSYVLSIRNSTLGFLNDLIHSKALDYSQQFGVDAIPHFRDATFKINLPVQDRSSFSVFGMGGVSRITFLEDRRRPCSFSYEDHGQDVRFGSQTGVLGVNFTTRFSPTTSSEFIGYMTYQGMNSDRIRILRDSIDNEVIGQRQEYWNRSGRTNYGTTLRLTKRIGTRHTLSSGVTYEATQYRYADTLALTRVTDAAGWTGSLRAFSQWRYRISHSLALNVGVNGIWFHLNHSWAIDPRAGMVWNITRKSKLSAAVGIHSQLQPLYLYFQEVDNGSGQTGQYNRSIGLTRSQHYVVGFDRFLTENLHWRLEAYFQNVTNVPVQVGASSWSMVNEGLDFKLSFPGILQNTGTAYNYGVEWTLERTFNQQYYYLFTATLYESKYTGSDGVIRKTDSDGNYILNFVIGREFNVGRGQTLNVGLRTNLSGGRRHTPIDLEESRKQEKTIYVDSLAYSLQFRDYFRTDLKFAYRINSPKVTHEIGLDLVNMIPIGLKGEDDLPEGCTGFPLSTRNILTTLYDPVDQRIRTEYQLGFLPIFYYRLQF
ncbi:MAG: M20/M25/M40 family metallo-hydrolase [Lewinellaceae bacterium]|nr:M20/M25/M40 family metallo-hydrolase [Saprospiraceae bacterium]MCB9311868.1 M20/M25/M40 family metallo-hydrolase [Lewinellaceae bacterium]HRW74295.1 M20/M25/M40 family metallo-hydrolase [Saprospiraceae bacterium]